MDRPTLGTAPIGVYANTNTSLAFDHNEAETKGPSPEGDLTLKSTQMQLVTHLLVYPPPDMIKLFPFPRAALDALMRGTMCGII